MLLDIPRGSASLKNLEVNGRTENHLPKNLHRRHPKYSSTKKRTKTSNYCLEIRTTGENFPIFFFQKGYNCHVNDYQPPLPRRSQPEEDITDFFIDSTG